MKNKLLRLAELIQDNFPEELTEHFKAETKLTLDDRLTLLGRARTHHQNRAVQLWVDAGKMRSKAERQATAQVELTSFLIAYFTGETREHAESATEAIITLGRDGETDLIKSLTR